VINGEDSKTVTYHSGEHDQRLHFRFDRTGAGGPVRLEMHGTQLGQFYISLEELRDLIDLLNERVPQFTHEYISVGNLAFRRAVKDNPTGRIIQRWFRKTRADWFGVRNEEQLILDQMVESGIVVPQSTEPTTEDDDD